MCFDPDEELCGDHHIIPGNYEERHGKLTIGRVHRRLGVRPWRILETCWRGEIRYRDLGDRIIIPIDAITEFLAKPNAERPDAAAASLSITKVANNERFEPTNTNTSHSVRRLPAAAFAGGSALVRNLTIGAVRNGLAWRISATRSDRRQECGMATARNPRMDRNPPAGDGILGM